MNKNKFAILIDSAATKDWDFFKENNIHVVPLSLADTKNKVYLDNNKDIVPETLFQEIEKNNTFKTSCTSTGILMDKIEELLEKNEVVYFLPVSNDLSSQYNQAKMLESEYEDKFFVIPSCSGGYSNEYIAKEMVKICQKYQNPQDVINETYKLFDYISTYFSCEDVTDLLKGGRISKAIALAVKLLKIKPVIRLYKTNQKAAMGKNYKVNFKKIIENIKEDFNNDLKPEDILSICLYYGGYDDEKKEYFLNEMVKAFKIEKSKIDVRWIPLVVLAHVRKDSYGITIACRNKVDPRRRKEEA